MSRFQGDGAAKEICEATEYAMQTWRAAPDALMNIRKGGAVNDMAWLDYDLARCTSDFPVPVFTGIGHERDSCVLNEVAHTKFNIPSKVIGGIETVMKARAGGARELSFRCESGSSASQLQLVRRSRKRIRPPVTATCISWPWPSSQLHRF